MESVEVFARIAATSGVGTVQAFFGEYQRHFAVFIFLVVPNEAKAHLYFLVTVPTLYVAEMDNFIFPA